jgi:hypothetical protein
MIEIAFGLLVGGVAATTIHWGMLAHIRRMRMLRHYRARFFEDAELLLKEDRLTDPQLLRLQRMIDDLDGTETFNTLRKVVSDFDANRKKYRPTREIVSREWASLMYSYLLAITYLRSIRGWFIRSMLANILDPRFCDEETEAIDERLHGNLLRRA